MHVYLLTRGVKHQVDEWIKEVSNIYLPYGPVNEQVQVALRPIQLWECVFAKEHFQHILSTIGGSPIDNQPGKKLIGAAFRKLLNAKKIPEFDMTNQMKRVLISQDVSGAQVLIPAITPNCVGIDWIGYREDVIWPDGKYKGYEQL